MHRYPAPADVDEAAVHDVPEMLDLRRVLAHEQALEAVGDRVRPRGVDQRLHGLGRGVDLTDAGDALVGVNEDDEIVLTAVGDLLVNRPLPKDDRLDVRDPQATPDFAKVRAGRDPAAIVDYSEIVNNPLGSPRHP